MKIKYAISNYILASKTTRFLNFIIDLLIMKLIIWALIISVDLILKLEIINHIDSFDLIEKYLFWSVVTFFYYTITETFLSCSLAKYFTKTIVVMEDGSKPKPLVILSRSILRTVPFEYFTFLQGRKPGLHDEYSKTFVVKKDKLENEKQ